MEIFLFYKLIFYKYLKKKLNIQFYKKSSKALKFKFVYKISNKKL